MISLDWAFDRLIESAATSLVLLTLGTLAALCCRQPVRRVRIIWLTLAACLAAPPLALLPGLPHWSLHQLAPHAIANEAPLRSGEATLLSEDVPPQNEDETPIHQSIAAGPTPTELSIEPARDVVAAPPDFASARDLEPSTDDTPHNAPAPATDDVAAEPAPAASRAALIPAEFDIRPWILLIYCLGLAGLAAWWLVGIFALRRVLRAARPAPPPCRALLRDIAGPASDRVWLLVSPRSSQPFTFAWFRPIIVLPENLASHLSIATSDDGSTQPSAYAAERELRWCLAHEWAHVVKGDAWVWSLTGLVRIVYFYQPLCWWLRRELRLCQDYLADAAAAQDSSPEKYAEFLATRALGQPFAMGLGIAARKSDLYRRVAMLVHSRRPLETRCPKWWIASASTAAIALVLALATLGFKSPTQAGEANADPAASDASLQASRRGQSETVAEPEAQPAPREAAGKIDETEPVLIRAAPLSDGDRRRLLAKLASRASRHPEGTIHFIRSRSRKGQVAPSEEFFFASSGQDWILRAAPAISPTQGASGAGGSLVVGRERFTMVFDGLCLAGVQKIAAGEEKPKVAPKDEAAQAGTEIVRDTQLHVTYSEVAEAIKERDTPFGLGTIYYESGRRFIEENAAHAKFAGMARLYGLITRIIEFDVTEEDAADAFPGDNRFLKMGGLLRLYVAPANDDAVIRIEGIDSFDTVQFRADCWYFDAKAVRGVLPAKARLETGATVTSFEIARISQPNEPAPTRDFILGIPEGVWVIDERYKVKDHPFQQAGPPAKVLFGLNSHEYPLHSFVTTADYPAGFPKKLLAELDRDVVPWNTTGKFWVMQAAFPPEDATFAGQTASPWHGNPPNMFMAPMGSPSSSPRVPANETPSTKGKSGAPTAPNPALRYGGKSFDEWRQVLVTDLDPETRVKALMALGTFGANGYSEKAAAAIADALKSDDPQANQFAVQAAACNALARLGAAGIPILEAQLASENLGAQRNAVKALSDWAASTEAVVPVLLKAANLRNGELRGLAYRSLARYHFHAADVADVLAVVFQAEANLRPQILSGLEESKVSGPDVTTLLVAGLRDRDVSVRTQAALIFATKAAGTAKNAEILEQALLNEDSMHRNAFVSRLRASRQRQTGPLAAEVVAPTIVALLESPESYTRTGFSFALSCFQILTELPSDKAAGAAVPALIKAVNGELITDEQPPTVNAAAAEALAHFGPAAKSALPALRRLLERGLKPNALGTTQFDSETQWRRHIESSIEKIEGK
ncbi:MAG TPA: HEAT repeat domain-containing protein [Planctomycetaceae bacterium]|nr:HEAT repeat domain-containing protein [Planctomycetaceae bacterium]